MRFAGFRAGIMRLAGFCRQARVSALQDLEAHDEGRRGGPLSMRAGHSVIDNHRYAESPKKKALKAEIQRERRLHCTNKKQHFATVWHRGRQRRTFWTRG